MKYKRKTSICTAVILLLSVLLSLLPLSAADDTVYSEGYFKYTISGDTAAIVGYFGSESEIVIPDSLGGRKVTEIRGRIFRSDLPLKKLTLPDTLTSIDDALLTALTQLRVVILQSRSISPCVPSGCVIIEDYPVYVDPDKVNRFDDTTANDPAPSETDAPRTDDKSGSETGSTDGKGNTGGSAGNNGNSGTGNGGAGNGDGTSGNGNAGSSTGGSGNKGGAGSGTSGSGAGFQEDGGIDGVTDKGIPAADGSVITVDNTGNLVMVDRDSNVTVIDRSKKYGIADDGDGSIIADENGDRVRVENDGATVVYPDGAGGESSYDVPAAPAETTASDGAAQDGTSGTGGLTLGVKLAICAVVIVPLGCIAFVLFSKSKKRTADGVPASDGAPASDGDPVSDSKNNTPDAGDAKDKAPEASSDKKDEQPENAEK